MTFKLGNQEAICIDSYFVTKYEISDQRFKRWKGMPMEKVERYANVEKLSMQIKSHLKHLSTTS